MSNNFTNTTQIFCQIPSFFDESGNVNPCFAWASPYLSILQGLNVGAYFNTADKSMNKKSYDW